MKFKINLENVYCNSLFKENDPILSINISLLRISSKTRKLLNCNDIFTVRDILNKTDEYFLNIIKFDMSDLNNLKYFLYHYCQRLLFDDCFVDFKNEILQMNINKVRESIAIHKPILLLLILNDLQNGKNQNLFYYSTYEENIEYLLKKYSEKKPIIINPQYPFWFLKTSSFWNLYTDDLIIKNTQAPTRSELKNAKASINDKYFQCLIKYPERINEIISLVIELYFPLEKQNDIFNDFSINITKKKETKMYTEKKVNKDIEVIDFVPQNTQKHNNYSNELSEEQIINLKKNVFEFEYSDITTFFFKYFKIRTFEDLVSKKESYYLNNRPRHIKYKLNEVNNVLKKLKLFFGMKIKNYKNSENEKLVKCLDGDNILDKSIRILGLSFRSLKALNRMDIKTIRNLVGLSESDLLKRKNFGIKSLNEINNRLDDYGLRFGFVENIKLVNDNLTQQQLLNLSRKVCDVSFSIRTINVLQNLNIETIGDIVSINESVLMREKNCGISSIREIQQNLDDMGLKFGMNISNIKTNIDNHKSNKLSQKQFFNLSKNISEISFSVRTKTLLNNLNIDTIGTLVSKNESFYLKEKNFGSKSLKEIQNHLLKMDLRFGMNIPQNKLIIGNISFFDIFIKEKYEDYLNNFDYYKSKTDFLLSLPEEKRFEIELNYMRYVSFSKEKFIHDAIPLKIKNLSIKDLGNTNIALDITVEEMLKVKDDDDIFKLGSFSKSKEKTVLSSIVKKSYNYLEKKLLKNKKLIDHIIEFEETLSEKEKIVFRGRNAFNSKLLTLDELGKTLIITRERVRQIEKKINKKLIETQLWDDIIADEFSQILNDKGFLYLSELGDWYSKIKEYEILMHNIISLSLKQNISESYPITGIKTENGWCFFKLSKEEIEQIIVYIKRIIKNRYPDFFHSIINSIQIELSQKFKPLDNENLIYEFFKIAANNYLITSNILFGENNSRSTYLYYTLYFSEKPLHINKIAKEINNKFNLNWNYIKVSSAMDNLSSKNSFFTIYQFNRGTYGLLKHFKDFEKFSNEMSEFFKDIISIKKQCRIEELLELAVNKYLLPDWFEWYHVQIILKENFSFIIKNGRVYSENIVKENIKDIAYKQLMDSGGKLSAVQLFDQVNLIKSIKITDIKMLPVQYPNKFSTFSNEDICLFSYLKKEIDVDEISREITNLLEIMYKVEFSVLSQNIKTLYPELNDQKIRSLIRTNDDLYFKGLKYVISKKFESEHLMETINNNNQTISELIF